MAPHLDHPVDHPLKLKRQAKGWTQAQLADEAGVSPAAVSLIETWQRLHPTYAMAVALARACECHPDELFSTPIPRPTSRAVPELTHDRPRPRRRRR